MTAPVTLTIPPAGVFVVTQALRIQLESLERRVAELNARNQRDRRFGALKDAVARRDGHIALIEKPIAHLKAALADLEGAA